MESKLIKIETYGMKNLKEKICIEFSNGAFRKNSANVQKIKAIYGMNGAGKSAIMNSIDLYKKLLSEKDYILSNKKSLLSFINMELKKFYFKTYFLFYNQEENKKIYYTHEIELETNDDDIYISREKMSTINRYNNEEKLVVYDIKNGELFCDETEKINKILKDKTINLLLNNTLIQCLYTLPILKTVEEYIKTLDKNIKLADNNILIAIIGLAKLEKNIDVYLEADDNLENRNLDLDKLFKILSITQDSLGDDFKVSSTTEIVAKSQLSNYIKKMKKLEKFIKIFKPQLKQIIVEKKEDKNLIHCSKKFDYGDYKIDSEYESTGIKRLMKMFNYLDQAIGGKYVFIDEMDANINGVFLEKILDFFIEYGKGTLCFTTHNMEPMKIMRTISKSLLFLGETGKLVSWNKNGNYSPLNCYKEGMIEDSPFNIENYDFLKIFDVGE